MICPYDWRCGRRYERRWDEHLQAYVYTHDESIYVPSMAKHPDRRDELVADWLERLHREDPS